MKRFFKTQFKNDKVEVTAQGFMKVPAFFTRTGVFTYRRSDGSVVRELRHPDDVFHPDSLASLQMAPLTNDHPDVFVNAENVDKLGVGWIGDSLSNEEGRIAGHAMVSHKSAIDAVNSGKKELSCGYTADMIEEAGVYNGEKYDMRQTNIRYNHVAIVDKGRAGPSVRLRLDHADAIEIEDDQPTGGNEMKYHIKIDGKDVEVTKEVFDAYQAESARADAAVAQAKKDADDKAKAEKEAEEAKKEKEKADSALKSETDKLQAKLDSVEASLKEHRDSVAPEKMAAMVQTRVKIEDAAKKILGADAKFDSKSNLEVMKEVITKKTNVDMADKSEDYVTARFDSIVEGLAHADSVATSLFRKADERKDADFDSNEAKNRNAKADSEAWKQPLAVTKK